MSKLPNHTALKEWSNVIEALGQGTQVVLIRKGGLADPRFGLEADRFYLYPTFFHQAQPAVEPRSVTITHWCEVVRTWRILDLSLLRQLEPCVVMPWETLETRYRFRPDQALQVFGVRAQALVEPRTIGVSAAYDGCRSWISLDDEIDVDGSTPALGEPMLEARLAEVDALLL